jgi:mono/diheme cytochrome c family protein
MTERLFVSIAVAVAVAGGTFAILALSGGDEQTDQRATTADRADWSDQGRRVYAAMGCGSCHRLAAAGSTGTLGPDLDEALPGHDRKSLVRSILRTQAKGFSAMPDDYGDRLTDTQLATLVSFLLASR